MNKYQRGKIYKLISNQTDKVYYGSTIEDKLTKRLGGHRGKYRRWLNGKGEYVSSFEIVKYDDCRIILVENSPCNTKYELTAREQYHIDNNECCNKLKAHTGLTRTEYTKKWYEENREIVLNKQSFFYKQNKDAVIKYQKQYHDMHKDKVKERMRNYYEQHKHDICDRARQYREENKEKIIQSNKQYREKHKSNIQESDKRYREANKEVLKQKQIINYHCACGSVITRKGGLQEHFRSNKHQAYVFNH